ncbi:hypothetical protein [Dinghuibacter silviterrae]|uniref:Prepilin-type processing-associated H-X9-DG protein n=1 Tax=Dinghuibacter silviterrae TaxID=1539049 RepID=A0A4R8DSC5_9BACT|nr:hypothetical protein [Dinghuibacter silviterrae]TDX01110.1 prepilin-type processing-associated H-X9-DG protein [Dinghuibacter silviterrae]
MHKLFSTLAAGALLVAGSAVQAQIVTLDYYFNNEWHRDKNGDSVRYHYTWEDKANSGFSKIGDVFTAHGFTLSSLPVAPTVENLRRTSVYIIVDPDTKSESPDPHFISPEDVDVLKNWVRSGGVLILMGNDKGNAEFEHFNTLATVFGIRFNEDCVNHVIGKNHDPGKIPMPGGDSIFKTPLLLYMKDVSSLHVDPPATAAILHGDTVLAATARYGRGTVFAVGDPWIYNEYIDNHNLSPEFQNTQGAEAWVSWIRTRVPGVDDPADKARPGTHHLQKLWETDTVVQTPESVLPDLKNHILYVSEIGYGSPDDFDGNGGVAKIGTDGKVIDLHWVTGLNSPKGLGRYGNTLYAADLTDVAVIDIPTGRVIKTIPVEGAKMLNDITVDDKGVVYVSDTRTAKIHRIDPDGTVTTWLTDMKGANGLKAIGQDLYILSGPDFLKAGPDKHLTRLALLDHGGDGLEPLSGGDWLATAWNGYVYYVYADGHVELLLDTHLIKKNTADIGYDPAQRIVFVPSFFGKTIAAYRLD